jgi:hypothetical protein
MSAAAGMLVALLLDGAEIGNVQGNWGRDSYEFLHGGEEVGIAKRGVWTAG